VGLAKYFARKFAVGGTARFVAKAYFFALRNNVFDIENCSTKNGLEAEIDKIVQFSLAVRFRMNPNHVHANQIYNVFKQGTESGLVGLTIAILAVEAGYYKNTPENMLMFYDIIKEELRKKHVGEAIL
jgi:hypothetical protein